MKLVLFGALLAAAFYRFAGLASRPMHADEAVLADRFATLLQTSHFDYDPTDFHGPALAWLTWPIAWIAGAGRLADLTETLLRTLPAICGLLLVLLSYAMASRVRPSAGPIAAGLAAMAPGAVYFSRYYIPEMLLVLLSGAALYCALRLVEEPKVNWAVGCGAALGFAFAAKETAVLVLAALAVGLAAARAPVRMSHVATFALAGATALLLSFGFGGATEAIGGLAGYAERAFRPEVHAHSWVYYAGVLGRSGEILLLAPATLALSPAIRRKPSAVLLLGYSGALAALYSAVRYKTPWCALGMLHGLILLAAIGLSHLAESRRRLAWAAAGILAASLAFQSARYVGPLASDPRNPYVYAHTTRDVFLIVNELRAAGAEGLEVDVFTRENWWPLPWYLRNFHDVGWRRDAPNAPLNAAIILVAPEMEADVARALYELPPPGERRLYRSLFREPVFLRPGVEVRGFALTPD